MSGGMSSIRTGMPFPSLMSPARATTRSASLSAAQIQVALAPGPSAASPAVTPAIMSHAPPLGFPGDNAAPAAGRYQRAVGAELVRHRAAVRRHEHSLIHSPAG